MSFGSLLRVDIPRRQVLSTAVENRIVPMRHGK